ncbi:hypothetical protein MMC11_006861 [Xylographa trunciseda]|nr:hypothetical protein [Xylographa trunciseda]
MSLSHVRNAGLLILSLLAFVAVIAAPLPEPLEKCHHDLHHIFSCNNDPSEEHIGIPEKLLQDFRLMAGYAAAAYCPSNNDSPGTQVTCPTSNCPLVEAANATTMMEFEDTGSTDDTGFVAVDDKNKIIVVAFRGSDSWTNWVVNLEVIRVPTGWCDDCNVHDGYWKSWHEIKDKIVPLVKRAVKEHPEYRIIITGHSLGAAVATIAAAEIRMIGPHYMKFTELYSYGSPRIGNRALAAFLSTQSKLSYRITAADDPIPRMPGAILGFRHLSPEYWIPTRPDDPSAAEIHVLEGYYNTNGNSGTHWLHWHSHSHYFGYISECGPPLTSSHDKRSSSIASMSDSPSLANGSALATIPAHSYAYALIRQHLNESLLVRQVFRNDVGTEYVNVTFLPGSVGNAALEAIYGPEASGQATVTFELRRALDD